MSTTDIILVAIIVISLRNQYTAKFKRLVRENELMRKKLVELYKKYDIDLDARLKILKMLREKKNDN